MQLLSTEGRGRCQTRTPAKLNAAALLQGEIPSSVRLPLLPFVPDLSYATELLFLTSALSPMEVPTRSIYVIATVTPAERPVTASITSVPRSLASALSPFLAGWMLGLSAFGWPLVVAGGVKIVYDLLLLAMFRKIRPPEEED